MRLISSVSVLLGLLLAPLAAVFAVRDREHDRAEPGRAGRAGPRRAGARGPASRAHARAGDAHHFDYRHPTPPERHRGRGAWWAEFPSCSGLVGAPEAAAGFY